MGAKREMRKEAVPVQKEKGKVCACFPSAQQKKFPGCSPWSMGREPGIKGHSFAV